MNPLEALNLLIQAASLAKLTRQEHSQVIQAGEILQKIIEKKTKESQKAGSEGVN